MTTRTLVPHTAYGDGPDITLTIEHGDEHIHIFQSDMREGRAIVIENREGSLQLLVYADDYEVPVVIKLPEHGPMTIDRTDYDIR